MAQQQNDNLNQMPTNENSFMNDVTGKNYPQNGGNIDPTKKGKPVGPNGNNAPGPVGMPPQHDASNMHLGPYSHPMQHHHMPPELEQQQQPMEHMYNPQGPPYGRYHDPNMPPMDMYNRYHPGGIEMKMPPNRPPPQRYPQQQPQASASNQPQQQAHGGHPHPGHGGPNEQGAPQQSQQPPNQIGQTPTLNSLLQSHQSPQPHQHHRYDQQSQQPGPQQPMQYGGQAWNPTGAPQQRPATYNPGLGQQAYRPPPPPNADPIGQNSNDSSNAAASSNSMAMRPTPSPTGSSGSRSMSPAIGPNAMINTLPPQGMPPYGSQSQQFPQGNYPARPQYPANYGQVNGPANVPNQNQYGRPMPNQAQYAPQSNYPTPPSPHMHAPYKPVNGPAPPNPGGGSPRLATHLKHHLLQKGYGNQSPTSPQSFVNGPGMHQPMGPPQMQHVRMQSPGSMGPPYSPHHNSQAPNTHQGLPPPDNLDNGINSSGSSASSQHPVTSIITTGPDGTNIDEASQQSTISNASAASDDPQCSTPKRKADGYNQSHLASGGNTSSMHDDFEMGSPTWPRTPASPVVNSHSEPTPHRSSSKTKSDSLSKLYEMDENPERRPWLDKLLSFMEERRTPITACPTISKQPLDLYRLYSLVKERGGFVEVCNVTKSKIWKDIAGMLGIGASSSAAYTLRKHYTKNLLAFECHFDRGGIDPAPIIQQVESGSKKKAPKVASAPSPDANHKGSSNSQDSFQQAQIQSPPGSSSTSMDSYNSYPAASQIQAPLQQQQIPPPQQNQQPAGSNAPNVPSPNVPQSAQYQPCQQPYNQYPVEQQQYGPPPGPQQQPFQQPQQGQFPAQNRYPPYVEAPESMPPQRSYSQHQPPQHHPPAPHPSQSTNAPTGPPSAPIGASPAQYPPAPIQAGPPQPMHNSSNYPQQMHNSQNLEYRQQDPPPQQRRHPDFGGAAPYPGPFPASNRSPYPNATPQHYNRSQFPPQAPQWANQRMPGPGYPQWNEQVSGRSPENRMPNEGENKVRIFSQQVQPPTPHQWNQPPMGNVPGNAIRPPQRHPVPGKQMTMVPPQAQHHKPGSQPFPGTSIAKRDIVFPSDSVEAVTPLLYRRKRLTKQDIGQTDIWRIFMCLQSGLLSESTWALDVLNILLFDDSSIQYFGLTHLPGLLTLLLDHFQKSLTDMFDSRKCIGRPAKPQLKPENKKRTNNNEGDGADDEDDDGLLTDNVNDKAVVDLGQVTNLPNPNDRIVVLHSTTNYTMCSRKGIPVKIKEADDDIFVLDTKRDWDVHGDIDCKNEQQNGEHVWSYGHLDPEPFKHIIDPFMGEFVDIPFAKYLKKSDRKRKASSDASTGDDSTTTMTTTQTVASNTNKNQQFTKSANDGDSSKTNVNNPKASVKEEKIDDSSDGPRIVENVSADVEDESKKSGKSAQTETVKSEQKDVDDSETATKPSNKSDATKDKVQSPNMDSDCREVDMELEKIPNGPLNNEASVSDIDSKKAKNDKTKLVDATSVKQPSFDVKKTLQDPAETLKRRRVADFEDECYARDEASLYLISETQDTLARRCISISNILRNLTFVPGNETVFANSETFLAILGRILLLHHKHPARTQSIRNYDREDDTDFSDSCSSLQGENEWWWDYLIQLRENVMVAVANIAGHMQLAKYDELIARPCLDGLLHWAICPSAHGQDPFPSSGPHSVLSPQRLALEALCKICVTDANVDLVIATPPFSRLENLCSVLTRHLCRNEDQVLREFSVNLLHYLAAADSSMARTVAMQSPCISYLVAFIEQAEQTALGIANQHGINYLRENPDAMGTSLDMLRRTAGTLLHLARHPDNRPLFLQQEQRLLGLVMSHILDQQVALIISRVLFQISRGTGAFSINESITHTSPVKRMKKRNIPPPPTAAHSNPKVNETSIAVS